MLFYMSCVHLSASHAVCLCILCLYVFLTVHVCSILPICTPVVAVWAFVGLGVGVCVCRGESSSAVCHPMCL